MVTRLDVCYTLTHRFYDTGSLMAQDDGKSTLGILSGQCVSVRMADSCVVNFNSNFVGLGGSDLDILDAEGLASLPGDGGLTCDGL